jgi:diadenosine tetraphosphate (Ap4A) HIT family hydrolase
MSQWHEPARWAALIDGTACPVCLRGRPLDVVCELEAAWVTMNERAPMRGYACLVSKRHVVELHDLGESEGAAFMRDTQRLSRAIATVTGAVKLNYEIHGNTLPHLHVHVFPRYRGDPFEGGPIDPRAMTGPVYARGEFVALRERLANLLVGA